ncbi:unknown [Prevotella sp. CAG:1092]|nr:unknown [Prevotella sp. CAG:1092]
MKRTIKLTESELRNMISESVKRVLKEDFEQDYNTARQNYQRPLWGFEMKNSEGEWQYGDITYDPNTNTMSCMGVTIDVDPSLSVDQNLEGLYEELMNNGFSDGDE